MPDYWRPVLGYEDLYLVNRVGQVYSIRNQMVLKPSANERGYLRVCLQSKGDKKWAKVHRIVAQSFIPNLEGKPTVDHINGIRDDNRVENLRWATMKEQQTSTRRDRASKTMRASASSIKKKRRVVQLNKAGVVVAVHDGMHDAARSVGGSCGNIYLCCNGKRKSCGGYAFQYADAMDTLMEVDHEE